MSNNHRGPMSGENLHYSQHAQIPTATQSWGSLKNFGDRDFQKSQNHQDHIQRQCSQSQCRFQSQPHSNTPNEPHGYVHSQPYKRSQGSPGNPTNNFKGAYYEPDPSQNHVPASRKIQNPYSFAGSIGHGQSKCQNVRYLSPEELAESRRKHELHKKVRELDPEWVKFQQEERNKFNDRTV